MFLLFALLACQGDSPEQKISELVAKLGDDSYAVREEAGRTLAGMGRTILAPLRRNLQATRDPEVQERLQGIIAELTRIRWENDLAKALAEAGRKNKPVLVFSAVQSDT